MLGKLTLQALPEDPIIIGASFLMGLVAISIIGLLFYCKRWGWLWREWITTVDHKKIGVMYLLLAFVMLPSRATVQKYNR